MNRYFTGITTLVLVSAGGIYLLAIRPSGHENIGAISPQKEQSPVLVAETVVAEEKPIITPALIQQEPLIQAPDEAKPLPPRLLNQLPDNETPRTTHSSPYAQIIIPAGQPVPELFPYQTERDEISRLASTYDVKQISAIASFLSHKDASVRESARQGLIQLGEEKAVPVLKEAAKKAQTPEEAALLTEAAEFLSLPSFVDVIFPKQSAPKS